MFYLLIIYKWHIFQCHVWLPQGNLITSIKGDHPERIHPNGLWMGHPHHSYVRLTVTPRVTFKKAELGCPQLIPSQYFLSHTPETMMDFFGIYTIEYIYIYIKHEVGPFRCFGPSFRDGISYCSSLAPIPKKSGGAHARALGWEAGAAPGWCAGSGVSWHGDGLPVSGVSSRSIT